MQSSADFSPDDFFAKLSKDELKPALKLSGMVKRKPESGTHFLFAVGGCSTWVEVPVASVAGVTLLEMMPCDDHTHPYVSMELKPATSPEGVFLSEILQKIVEVVQRIPAMMQRTPIMRDAVMLGQEGGGDVASSACTECWRTCGSDFFKCSNKCFPKCP
ncbi:MAG: hypothetical protein AB7S41_03360 [Parvibaculaceae bacterium]